MKRHLSFFLVLLFTLLFCSSDIFSYVKPKKQIKNGSKLERILEKCAEYCKTLTESSIYFSCKERIEEKIFHSQPGAGRILKSTEDKQFRKSDRNIFVYDYKFDLEEQRVIESRILIEENSRIKREDDAQLKTKLFKDKIVIFEPIGIFSEDCQKYHEYKIINATKFKGENAIVIKASPQLDLEMNRLSGKFWVRENDFSILKIEWIQTVLGGFEGIDKTTEGLNVTPFITYSSEYSIEKKGIRFPSKYSIKEVYIGPDQERFIRSETEVTYEDYKFFTIEAKIKYLRSPNKATYLSEIS